MTRWQYLVLNASAWLTLLSGVLYGWFRYGVQADDPYAVVNHPWQPLAQHLHVLVSPALVLALGAFWSAHAAAHWRAGARGGRVSGLAQWACALPMIFSGYALQISVADTLRRLWIAVHVAASLIWVAGYGAHLLTRWRLRRAARQAARWVPD